MNALDIIKDRLKEFKRMPEEQQQKYASRYSIHNMEPIPFFTLVGYRKSGAVDRVDLYKAIDTILKLQKENPTTWRNIKGSFALIVDYINRLRMAGICIPIQLRNFDKGEMGLISMAYSLIHDQIHENPDKLKLEINALGWELETPFAFRATFMFYETVEKVIYHYFIHDLSWFLQVGPLWFLGGSNVHCVSDEDDRWLKANREHLETWEKIRSEFLPFIVAKPAILPETYTNFSIL